MKGPDSWLQRPRRAHFPTDGFARYGPANAETVLVKLDDAWRELGSWTYPAQVVAKMGKYSISGGIWSGGSVLVTGHDEKAVFRLRLPAEGEVLDLLETLPSPFPGQGIASDPKTGGLVGINRDKAQVIFAQVAP